MAKKPSVIDFAKEIYSIWITERPTQLAAALAYYSIFSFAPAIFIAFTLAGFFIGEMDLVSQFLDRIELALGPETAQFIEASVSNIAETTTGGAIFKSLISFIALLLAASGAFFQLQFALNTIWKVPPPKKGGTQSFLRQRLFSFLMVISLAVIIIALALANIIISAIASFVDFGGSMSLLNVSVSISIVVVSLILVYKIVPDTVVAWRDVWLGALVATFLIVFGLTLVSLYLGSGIGSSALEAAGSLAVILISFYYLSQIFLFGAVITKVYAYMFGSRRTDAVQDETPESV